VAGAVRVFFPVVTSSLLEVSSILLVLFLSLDGFGGFDNEGADVLAITPLICFSDEVLETLIESSEFSTESFKLVKLIDFGLESVSEASA
jgi:hypothetical protein